MWRRRAKENFPLRRRLQNFHFCGTALGELVSPSYGNFLGVHKK
jgi:hypothetical protein